MGRIGWRIGWLELGFLALVMLALGMRLWELDGRTMHYDEAIHLHYSWRLANLEPFIHSPWLHGPFQIELAALGLRCIRVCPGGAALLSSGLYGPERRFFRVGNADAVAGSALLQPLRA